MVTNLNSFGSEDDNAPRGRCEDAPCCGCCPSGTEYYDPSDEIEAADMDGDDCTQDLGEEDEEGCHEDDDGDEPCGGEDRYLDAYWESQTECDFGGGDF
jgi:hypothetical protein